MCTGSNLKFKTKNTKITKDRKETDRFCRSKSQLLSCKMRWEFEFKFESLAVIHLDFYTN